MSGGSYNYLHIKLQDDDWTNAILDLIDMESRLRAANYIEPANRIKKFIDAWNMYNKLLQIRANDIIELARVVEWVDSGDFNIETLDNWCEQNCNEVNHASQT